MGRNTKKHIRSFALVLAIMMSLAGCHGNDGNSVTLTGSDAVMDEPCAGARYETLDEKTDAYDYIIEIMAAPQYWSDSQWDMGYKEDPPYAENKGQRAGYFETLETDRTGWKMVLEGPAAFQRGYDMVLRVNFSGHSAIILSETGYGKYLDFGNNDFYSFRTTSGSYEKFRDGGCPNGISDFEDFGGNTIGEKAVSLNESKIYGFSYEVSDDGSVEFTGSDAKYNYVRDIFTYYEEIFTSAGCPLLGKPEGTLEKYKGKTVNRVKKTDDGLIHAIWEQDGWCHDWTREDGDAVWIENIDEVFEKEHPDMLPGTETGTVKCTDLMGCTTELTTYTYTPVFLVTTVDMESYAGRTYMSDYGYAEELAIFYLKPIMEEIYGYNAVYFYDGGKLETHSASGYSGHEHALETLATREQVQEGVFRQNEWGKIYRIDSFCECQVSCYDFPVEKGSDLKNTVDFLLLDYDIGGLMEKFTEKALEKRAEGTEYYSGHDFINDGYAEYMFADEWMDNFELCYDYDAQCILGLF